MKRALKQAFKPYSYVPITIGMRVTCDLSVKNKNKHMKHSYLLYAK